MYYRHLYHIRWSFSAQYKQYNNIRYISNLHATVSNDSLKNFREKKGKGVERQGSVYVKNPETARWLLPKLVKTVKDKLDQDRPEDWNIDSIASCIAKEWNGGYLFEANPGPGILSNSFLQKGIQHLRVFEKNKDFLPALEVLKAEYPALEIVKHDLLMIPSFEFKKNFDQSNYAKEYFDNIFKDIPVHSWEKDTSFQIFAVMANKRSLKFLRYLLAAVPNQPTLFSFGRCDFFLFISETEFKCMSAKPKENFTMYRWSTVLYNIFYDIKYLEKFPANSENFYFASGTGSKKRKRTPCFYLIKLTPKSDIFNYPMTPEKLQELFFFVRSNLAKRTDLVIKSIERWMPFCGPRLIKEGFNVFMKFGDLSPTEIVQLFNCISSWSEYKNCYSEALACKFYKKKLLDDDGGIE